MSYKKTFALVLAICCCLLTTSCEEEPVLPPQQNPVPSIYSFERDNNSTVNYPGQVVRQLLIQDMKIAIDQLGESGASAIVADDLLKYFDKSVNSGGSLQGNILTNVGSFPTTVLTYFDIHPDKDLLGKLHSGFDLENTIRTWIDILVTNSNDPAKIGTSLAYIHPASGLDLAQAINKTLLGAVVFSQGVNTYLADIENRENNELRENENFTDREHRFDEAFGYFGGARNFFDFSDNDLASKDGGVRYKDNFVQDGKIDFSSEYNFGFSTNAGKRDRGSSTGLDYSKDLMDAFLEGRTAIVNKDDVKLLESKTTIIETWEKVIAATVIHYINDVIENLEELQADPGISRTGYYKHWAEMYYFTQAFRYNDNTTLDHATLLTKMAINGGANPVYLLDNPAEIDNYKTELLAARDIFQSTYSFDLSDVEGW